MKTSTKFRRMHTNIMKMGNELNDLRSALVKLQEEAGELANLHIRLEDLRDKRYRIAEEFKEKRRKRMIASRISKTHDVDKRKQISVINQELDSLHKQFTAMTPKIKELRKDIKSEYRHFKKSRKKAVDFLDEFFDSLKLR